LLITRADQAPEVQRRTIDDAFAEMGREIDSSGSPSRLSRCRNRHSQL